MSDTVPGCVVLLQWKFDTDFLDTIVEYNFYKSVRQLFLSKDVVFVSSAPRLREVQRPTETVLSVFFFFLILKGHSVLLLYCCVRKCRPLCSFKIKPRLWVADARYENRDNGSLSLCVHGQRGKLLLKNLTKLLIFNRVAVTIRTIAVEIKLRPLIAYVVEKINRYFLVSG